ncbi:MAG TPA: hydroxyacylglutathione hydrolase [Methylophilaceae bacterium]|nr:hydroxyacylglutathione hydrolase [Methylophilaceae bacterium]
MLEILPIPAFRDNYIWLLSNGNNAALVDPGDADPAISALEARQLTLDAILITHHHSDHIGGVPELLKRWPAAVYAPKREHYAFPHTAVVEGSRVILDSLQLQFSVMEVPGHTLGHVAYYGANCLFCGDTLFSGGCGRLFEGAPRQLFDSLQRFAALPPETKVFCAHEYTETNLGFARSLDPDNPFLTARITEVAELRRQGLPSLPSTIGLERETNPFLRCDVPAIRLASGTKSSEPVEVFTRIREMRNNY